MASDHHKSNAHHKGDGSYEQDFGSGSFKVPVKALNIIWGNDPRFWRFMDLKDDESRSIGFNQGALLVQVNWIEVTGRVPKQALMSRAGSGGTRYEIYYVVKFRVDAFGWHSAPVKFMVRLHNTHHEEEERDEKSIVLEPYRETQDAWREIPGGQFTVSNSDGFVEFGMFEIDSAWWKGNMVLAGVKIKPIQGQ